VTPRGFASQLFASQRSRARLLRNAQSGRSNPIVNAKKPRQKSKFFPSDPTVPLFEPLLAWIGTLMRVYQKEEEDAVV
jgi:hypothetical protein